MAKGKHRESQRVVLPNGLWVLLYEDGHVKIAGYDRRIQVTEVLNRADGAHVFMKVEEASTPPKAVADRPSDLVTVPRSVLSALQHASAVV
jgi:hypothetical protein